MHSGYTFRTRAIMTAQVGRGWAVAGVTGLRHLATGPDKESADGLNFFRTRAARWGVRVPVLGECLEISALADKVTAVAARFRPDIIHAHSPCLDGIAGLIAARQLNLPFVYEIRAFWEDAAVGNGTGREGSAKYRLTRALETWVAKQADAVAVICEGLRGDLVARGVAADKIFVSPNGVDLGLFGSPSPPDDALAAQLGLMGADVIGFIGSYYDYEGLDDLVSAMPFILAERPNAHLLLVGGGPMEKALKDQVKASDLDGRVHFIGRVPHHAVERYYSLIDILAYPRKKMRLTDLVTPLKPLEAMAQGKLVAASDVGGHRELIEDGVTGTLFAPDSPAATAQAIVGLFADRKGWEHRRSVARAYVERDRNWSSNISRYEPVYQRLIA